MNRKQFHGAPYNPRTLDRRARAKLEKNLRRIGLIQPIVVNLRTNNIIAGHQRIALIDSIENRDDYEIDVSVCDLSEEEEKTQNIAMNNQAMMGTWNTGALESLLKDINREALPDTGFDPTDIAMYFPDDTLAPMFALEKQPESVKESLDEIDKIAKIKEDKKRAKESAKEVDTEVYSVVRFESREQQMRFHSLCGADQNTKYIDGDRVFRLLGDVLNDEGNLCPTQELE